MSANATGLHFPMPQPRFELLTRFTIERSLRLDLGKAPRGRRAIDFVGAGRFDGPRLAGRVIDGTDHLLMLPDGSAQPDVRLGLKTDDGVVLSMRYTGTIWGPKEVMRRVAKGEPVDPAEYYFRTHVVFEAPSNGPYDWLNRCLCIGVGQPGVFDDGPDGEKRGGAVYDIHRLG